MIENIKNAFAHRVSGRLPRGEFWIGTNIFAERKIEDNVNAHVAFCREMRMDFISVPAGRSGSSELGYRTFNPSEIQDATESGLFVVAVVSGPFQRIVDEKGLGLVLADIARDTGEIRKAIEREAKTVNSLLKTCIECGADAVMIAEDIAFDSGSFFSPTMFHNIFQPLYSEFVDNIHGRGALAVFHSCGNITNLMPDIVSSKFDGLSCQIECLDILPLKRTFGARITFFTGMSREFIDNKSLSAKQKQQFSQIVTELGADGGFVLSTSSGLHSTGMVSKMKKLYALADKTWERPQ
jgi:hypothetical protein